MLINGLIAATPDPEDGRAKRIALTRKGTLLLEELRARCVWFIGGTGPALYNIAWADERHGIKNLFRADSFATGSGGAKGMLPPEGWGVTVKQFLSVLQLRPG